MKRRVFLKATAAGALSTLFSSTGFSSIGSKKPQNVLFVSIDDLNDWVGFLGGYPNVYTPNIDRMARNGIAFSRAYCNAPACNPSRVSTLTSMRPSTTEIYTNKQRFREFVPDVVTLPQYFRIAGYHVIGGGKIFHGEFPYRYHRFNEELPHSVAWQQFDRDLDSWDEYYAFSPELIPAKVPLNGFAERVFDWGPIFREECQTPDAQLAAWAADFLRKSHSRPFFFAVGFYRPHLPWYVPNQYFDQYPIDEITLPLVQSDDLEDIPAIGKQWARNRGLHDLITTHGGWRTAVQAYLASITFVDHQLGQVLDALDRGPNNGNTLIVLWSDHGWHLGEKLHWQKFTLWEEATRVPLILSHPSFATVGSLCNRVVSLLDLYPTIVELCGLNEIEQWEGKSLMPLLMDTQRPWPIPAITTWGIGNHAVRTEQWRYIRYSDGSEELYDEENDPNEWSNLASKPEFADIKQQLRRWITPIEETEQSLIRRVTSFVRKG